MTLEPQFPQPPAAPDPHRHSFVCFRFVLGVLAHVMYTSGFQYNSCKSCRLQKYFDDSAVARCISHEQEAEYKELVDCLINNFFKSKDGQT